MNLRDKFKDKWRWVGLFVCILTPVLAFTFFNERVTILGCVACTAAYFIIPLMTRFDIDNNPKCLLWLLVIPPAFFVAYLSTKPDSLGLVSCQGFGLPMGVGVYFLVFGGRWPSREKQENPK